VIVCVVGPSFPGLAIRTDTSRFAGAVCAAPAAAAVGAALGVAGGATDCAAASTAVAIVCVTALASPGLPMRIETLTFDAAVCTAVASAAGAAVSGGNGGMTSSALAGTAKPSASAPIAMPDAASRRGREISMLLASLSSIVKYPARNAVCNAATIT
jgi:hypothetical protein